MHSETSNLTNFESVFDVNTFCKSHKISRAFFYQLLKEGKGPRIVKLGKRTLITKESAAAWRARLEAENVE